MSTCELTLSIVCLLTSLLAQDSTLWLDPSPHRVQFVDVNQDIRLEVLDWGGLGRPLVLLAGGGNTAHVFDEFAPKLTNRNHVYGITRRGFASSATVSGFSADRLADDVLVVLDALKLEKPVLVGHSLGGEEMSSLASRHPERVAGLVYLEAAHRYAFYDGPEDVPPMPPAPVPPPPGRSPGPTDLESFAALRAWNISARGYSAPEAELRQSYEAGPAGRLLKRRGAPNEVGHAIMAGIRKFTNIPVPALAIFALSDTPRHQVLPTDDPAAREAANIFARWAWKMSFDEAQAFEKGVPGARVIRLPLADHYVFLSAEGDVLREMAAFLAALN